MRLLLKTKNDIVNLYWVKAENNKSVKGWCAGTLLKNELGISNTIRPDFHFTYPESGEYHFSLKSKESYPEIYINIFWNRVKIKTITSKNTTIIKMTKEKFDNTKQFILGHLMVNYQTPKIDDVDQFQFPLVGFNIFNGDFNRGTSINIVHQNDVNKDDLVVDISSLNKFSLNAYAFLRKKSHIISLPKILKDNNLYIKSEQVSDTHYLDLICTTGLNDNL